MDSRFGLVMVCCATAMLAGCHDAHERGVDANVDAPVDPCALEDGEWTSVGTVDPSSTDPACRAQSIPEWRVRSLQEVIRPNPCELCDACDATLPVLPDCSSSVTLTCASGLRGAIVGRRISETELQVTTRITSPTGLTCVINVVATRLDH